jgi:glutamyl-tRNA synthetase
MGYLPHAVRNYLVRLGWSQGDREFFTTPEMIEAFDLAGIGRSAGRFDFAKLENVNGHYMRAASCEALLDALEKALPFLPNATVARFDPPLRAKLLAAMPGLKERAKTLVELLDGAAFLFAERPLAMDEKAQKLIVDGRGHIEALLPRFAVLPDWTAAAIEAEVRAYVAETGVKLGQVAQPMRAALTGRSVSPGVFDVFEVLGREESLGRLSDQAMT